MPFKHASVFSLKNSLLLTKPVLLGTLLALTLVSCGDSKTVEAPKIDFVAEAMPFPQPKIDPLYELPGVPELPETTQRVLDVQRAFFARQFGIPELALNLAHDNYLGGLSKKHEAWQIIESIKDTQLAGIDACTDWLRDMPDSYAAHWLCAAMWQSGAWASRGEGASSEVSSARFAIMEERLQQSDVLLEQAIKLTPKPLEALKLLAENRYLEDDQAGAEALLERAEEIKPDYAGIHWTRMNYAQAKWGGSDEAVKAAFERAQKAGVDADSLADMEDSFIVQPWNMSNPGATSSYYESAIQKHPTRERMTNLRSNYFWAQNWNKALQAATRLMEAYPGNGEDYYWRARIYSQLGRIPEASVDYRMAAAMGNNLALQELIMANIRGGLGLKGKSNDEAFLLCRYGASLGLNVGANCIGSLNFEAHMTGIPMTEDKGQGMAWHLLAARGGHFNSQYDLGLMLFNGEAVDVDPKQAKRLGIFWLRRAAEQGHKFAARKLEENHIGQSEQSPQSENPIINLILVLLYKLSQILP